MNFIRLLFLVQMKIIFSHLETNTPQKAACNPTISLETHLEAIFNSIEQLSQSQLTLTSYTSTPSHSVDRLFFSGDAEGMRWEMTGTQKLRSFFLDASLSCLGTMVRTHSHYYINDY